jgi:hypothetical protein
LTEKSAVALDQRAGGSRDIVIRPRPGDEFAASPWKN